MRTLSAYAMSALPKQLRARAQQRLAGALPLEIPGLPVRRPVLVAQRELDAQEDVGVQALAQRQPREGVDELDDGAATERHQMVGVESARGIGGKTGWIDDARDIRSRDEGRGADRVSRERDEHDGERERLQRVRHASA